MVGNQSSKILNSDLPEEDLTTSGCLAHKNIAAMAAVGVVHLRLSGVMGLVIMCQVY